MVLCNAQRFTSKTSIEDYHPQTILCKSFKNDCVSAAVNDIEDGGFWKAIYCLLHTVFPSLKAVKYCDFNIAAMDKIYYLMKQADEALINSQLLHDDRDCLDHEEIDLSDCKEELDEVLGETNTERIVELLR